MMLMIMVIAFSGDDEQDKTVRKTVSTFVKEGESGQYRWRRIKAKI